MLRKIIACIFFLSVVCSFVCCGKSGDASSGEEFSENSQIASDHTDASAGSLLPETSEKLTSEEVLAASEHLVGLCDQIHGRIIVCDLAVEDWSNDNAVVWEYHYEGNGHIAGIKFRHSEYWGEDVVIFCAPGAAVILSYKTKEILYKTSEIGWNPHSVELLPDGTFIVASSTDNLVSVFAPGETKPSQTLEHPNAHGVLWDPEFGMVWMAGTNQLTAFQVSGAPSSPRLKAVSGMTYQTPQAGLHDLAPVYGDPNALLVTCSAGIMKFDKEKETFSYSYSGGKHGQQATYAPGCGLFEDGVFVYTSIVSGQTVYQDWCTNEVCFYVPLGGIRGRYLTRKAPDDAYYKVRVFDFDYQ